MNLSPWRERWAREESYHFNPAYCGALIYEFVRAYENAKDVSTPFPLVFCALPIVLHPATRSRLPVSTASRLFSWLEDNRDVKVGFSRRAADLTPYVREAIRYAVARKALTFAEGGVLALGPKRASFTPSALSEATTEVRDTVYAVRKVARWFAAAGDTPTVLAAWGLRL